MVSLAKKKSFALTGTLTVFKRITTSITTLPLHQVKKDKLLGVYLMELSICKRQLMRRINRD